MTIRDADRIKDKLEVSLEGRQVFFLFFGGAVLACLVFVLGVMVGKRLEGRERVARKAATSAAVDPLAALDELGEDERAQGAPDELAFPAALAGDDKAKPRALGAADLPPQKPLLPDGQAALLASQRAAAAQIREVELPEKTEKQADTKDKPEKVEDAAASSRFTLQISSFQERTEADALAAKLAGSGYKPLITMSNVPDKGVFFRVRVGDFDSRNDALSAKEEFEKKQHIIAYVTKQ